MGFRPLFSPDDLTDTLFSQVCLLETAPRAGLVDTTHIPRLGSEEGVSDLPLRLAGRPALTSPSGFFHHNLMSHLLFRLFTADSGSPR